MKIRSRKSILIKLAVSCCSLVLAALWLRFLYSCLQAGKIPRIFDPLYLFSYRVSLNTYRKSVPGLTYKEDNLNSSFQHISMFSLGDLLSSWNPDDTCKEKWLNSVAHPNRGQGVPRFNYMNLDNRKQAYLYRDAEVPFVLFNIPELNNAAKDKFSFESLVSNFGEAPKEVELIASNKYMYFSKKVSKKFTKHFPDWKPPQSEISMTFKQFIFEAKKAESGPDRIDSSKPLYYYTISAGEGANTDWIKEALPFFSPNESLFMVDVSDYKGINCRFGMKGVIAAAHYDGKRNFIAMIRGRKRYVILPPEECEHLLLYPKGHPSGRHSQVDWADNHEISKYPNLYNARATELVLSMGEMLYLPSYWFHYIVSQDASIQCNSRSGDSLKGQDVIHQCGFKHGNQQY